MMTPPLLAAEGLVKDYAAPKVGWFGRPGRTRILDGVSFTLAAGETLGLVGESGSGKSTTGRLIMRLQPTTEGAIRWRGQDVGTIPLPQYRRDVQMIFQEPGASLNPAYRVRQTLDGVASSSGSALPVPWRLARG
jgi:ABC-type glutathione transport system ATPase component